MIYATARGEYISDNKQTRTSYNDYNMKQKITHIKLARYLFTAVLALLFVSCNKSCSSPPNTPPRGYTTSFNQMGEEISSDDYELSADGLTLIKWHNHNTKNLDMNRDTRLRKVKEIGNYAFGGLDLTSIIISSSTTSIGKGAFVACNSLKEIIIPNSVTSIGVAAFNGCQSLTEVIIPNSVTEIGDGAFMVCNSLKKVIISNSVTNIGAAAFNGCQSLTEVIIPSSVTKIGTAAFWGCDSLIRVTFMGENPPKISYYEGTFGYIYTDFELIIPKGGARILYTEAGYPEDRLIEQ